MTVSLCVGQVLFDNVYLPVEWTSASTKCWIESFKPKETWVAVLVPEASNNRKCMRQGKRHGQWFCNEKAAVLAWHRSKILEHCGKLFSFISFVESTSAPLAPRAGVSQLILLLFSLFSCSSSWICLQNVASDFYVRSQNLVALTRWPRLTYTTRRMTPSHGWRWRIWLTIIFLRLRLTPRTLASCSPLGSNPWMSGYKYSAKATTAFPQSESIRVEARVGSCSQWGIFT